MSGSLAIQFSAGSGHGCHGRGLQDEAVAPQSWPGSPVLFGHADVQRCGKFFLGHEDVNM